MSVMLVLGVWAIAVGLFAVRSHGVLAVWVVAQLCLAPTSVEVGPAAVYAWDLPAILGIGHLLRLSGAKVQEADFMWFAILASAMFLGVVSSIYRYGVSADPFYIYGRQVIPVFLILVSGKLQHRAATRAIATGAAIGALVLFAIVAAQSVSDSAAITIERVIYGKGSFETLISSYRIRYVMSDIAFRSYGSLGASTTLGGTAVVVFMLIWRLRSLLPTGLYLSAQGALLGTVILSFTRHALLALVAGGIVIVLFGRSRPQETPWGRVVSGVLVVFFAAVVAGSGLWAERLTRGGLHDPNISARLVEGPSAFFSRVAGDPLMNLMGVGLSEKTLPSLALDPAAMDGFVSNGLLLWWFYSGAFAFVAFLAFLVSSGRRASGMRGDPGAAATLGPLAGLVVVLMADNYSYLNWSSSGFIFLLFAVVRLGPSLNWPMLSGEVRDLNGGPAPQPQQVVQPVLTI